MPALRDGTIIGEFGRPLTPHLNSSGYPTVTYQGKSVHVHRLVAEAHVPNPEGLPSVDHIDGDKTNNHASNLEWVTVEENIVRARAKAVEATRDGVVYEWYRSIAQAARLLGARDGNIVSALRGRQKTSANRQWRYSH